MIDASEVEVTERVIIKKFGGPAPKECREEDLLETWILENGRVVSIVEGPGSCR